MHISLRTLKYLAAGALLATAACRGGSSTALLPAAPAMPDATLSSPADSPDVKSPIKLTASSFKFTATGAASAKTVTATEAGYKGKLSQKNTCGAIAAVTPLSAKGPKAKFTVTPASFGTCTITVSDKLKHKAVVKIDVSLPAPGVAPASLSLVGTGAAHAKTLTVSEAGYHGPFKAASTCGAAASVTPTANGPSAVFTVTPAAAVASCTLTFSDLSGRKASAGVGIVVPNALTANPTSLSFDATGGSYALPSGFTEAGYTGAFVEKDTCAGIATLSATAWTGPTASTTVTPAAAGTCTITVSDSYGQSAQDAITVTTSGIIISGKQERLPRP